ncbi:CcdB family protein [Klebsiella quasipneumoniae]|uniref:CcdB family protein n=1 Tax=Klebsiella quasipneumoniae TaxID=1463165 RepID=UPI0035564270
MAAQFDIFRNPSSRTNAFQPYLMVIQHDYFNDLGTRLIVPLSYHSHLTGHYHAAAPVINMEFGETVHQHAGNHQRGKAKAG